MAAERRAFFKVLSVGMTGFASLITSRAGTAQDAKQARTGVSFRRLCVTASDLERSVKFYTEAFGFAPDARPGTLKGPQMSAITELTDVDATWRLLDMGGGDQLQLYGFANPKVIGDGKRKPMNNLGLCLLSLWVSDMSATLAAVRKAGGTVLEEARIGPAGPPIATMVLDPDGTRIELVKRS